MNEQSDFYKTQGKMSTPGKFEYLYTDLPNSIQEICNIVHSVIIHRDATDFYGYKIPEKRKTETETRYVEKILAHILELDNAPLTTKRPAEKRFAGTCRDFALLFCSILRFQKIPARLRCGFAGYFNNMWDDHWICEYFDEKENRWIIVDPEIDEVETKAYNLTVNPLNIPQEKFLTGGQAWLKCRSKELNPDLFGVSTINIQGMWFVRSNVVRDLACLNKMEMLPWDQWGIADKDFDTLTKKELNLLDEVAKLTVDDTQFEETRKIYQDSSELRVPQKVHSYTTFDGEQMVEIEP